MSDVIILTKKILVGIIIFLLPFTIIFGGLYLTQQLLQKSDTVQVPENTITSRKH